MASVSSLLAEAHDLADGLLDAELLLSAALDKPRTYLLAWPEADVPVEAARHYLELLRRRRAGEPVAYLLGEREFWSLRLAVTPATLIPRPETELLVEQALALAMPPEASVLDLGTGSGAIALALASERPRWRVTGVDQSAAALEVASRNGRALDLERVQWLQGRWFDPVDGCFDLIVSNPPYVAPGDPHLHAGDVAFEPRSALVANDGGLADLRAIVNGASEHMAAGAWLLLEHGFDQSASVRQMLSAAGFNEVASVADLAGHERVSLGRHGSH